MAESHRAAEGILAFAEHLHPMWRAVRLHPLGGLVVEHGAMQLRRRGEAVPQRDVVAGLTVQPVGHLLPSGEELVGPDVCSTCCGVTQWRAHLVDLTDLGTTLHGDGNGEVPDVVAGEVLEHGVRPAALRTARRREC